jgi:uncharacterized protein YjiS (DUF1127 family)
MTTAPLSAGTPFAPVSGLSFRLTEGFKRALRRYRRARDLRKAELYLLAADERLLRDIGLTRHDVSGAVRGRR